MKYIMKINGELVNSTDDERIVNWWLEMVGITKQGTDIECERVSEEEFQNLLENQRKQAYGE